MVTENAQMGLWCIVRWVTSGPSPQLERGFSHGPLAQLLAQANSN